MIGILFVFLVLKGAVNIERSVDFAESTASARGALVSVEGSRHYSCGKFGNQTYAFPKQLTGIFAEYEGDEPWSSNVGRSRRTCADSFRSTLFRACLPNMKFVSFFSDHNGECFIVVTLYSRPNENSLEEFVLSRRSYNVNSGQQDRYDKSLDLYSFDESFLNLNRVFWRPESSAGAYVLGRCNISVPVPHCEFKTYSSILDGSLSIRFRMSELSSWEGWMRAIEKEIIKFKMAS